MRRHLSRRSEQLLDVLRRRLSYSSALAAGGTETEWSIVEAAQQKPTGVSLQTLLNFGKQAQEHGLSEGMLTSAQFLKRELPIRFAHRIVELDRLPLGLCAMPSVRAVRDWYRLSFEEIRAFPPISGRAGGATSEAAFTNLLRSIFERHNPTIVTMARGIFEFRQSLGVQHGHPLPPGVEEGIHHYLDHFFTSRVGIRTLIAQQIALHEPPVPGYVGIVDTRCSPHRVISAAIDDARAICSHTLGEAPDVRILGSADSFEFAYVPSYMRHVCFELLKNSMRAVVERHRNAPGGLPPVCVVISAGSESEDVVIKISDEGGGIPRSGMARIFSYFYTTSPPQFADDDEENGRGSADDASPYSYPGNSQLAGRQLQQRAPDFSTALPMSGLGVGLPLSRVYSKYFGGDLQLISMEGYGTDAFVYLRRLGDAAEPLSESLCIAEAHAATRTAAFSWGRGSVFFEPPRGGQPHLV